MALPVQAFSYLEPSLRTKLERVGKIVDYKKGEPLFHSDDLLEHFYLVLSGRIKNYQLNLENAKEQTLFIFRAGDMFDIFVLLDGEPHDVIYEGFEDGEVLQLPIEVVRELLEKSSEFRKIIFPYIAKQMRHVEEIATDLALYSTSDRLIKLLLQHLDPNNIFRYNILDGLSHTEIAKLIGTVRHVVERHLKKLKKDGILDTKNRHIKINNATKLLEQFESII